jgi:hypothetical protein
MSDIFISYSSKDRDRILPLVNALEKAGWSVFWDRTIPAGKTWRQVIESEIQACRSIVVVWTETSVHDPWVLEEAEEGKSRGILIPVLLDELGPPTGFRTIQAVDLVSWNGDTLLPAFSRLIGDITAIRRQEERERLREEERQRAEEEAKRRGENRRRNEEERNRVGKFFFSYARADSEFVLKLAEDLRSTGTNLWLDQLDIPAGARWDEAVEAALHASPCLLVVLSPASVASNNVMDEVSFGLETDKRIVPILFKDCAVPFRLRRLHHIDFRAGYDDGFTRLLQALKPVDQLLMPPSALGAKATEGETDPLERLRKQMLVARTSLELRQLLYELDAYLANDPHSPEARLLKDKMQGAIRQAEQMERRVPASPRKLPKTPIWLVGWLIGLVALGSIVYALLRFLGLL